MLFSDTLNITAIGGVFGIFTRDFTGGGSVGSAVGVLANLFIVCSSKYCFKFLTSVGGFKVALNATPELDSIAMIGGGSGPFESNHLSNLLSVVGLHVAHLSSGGHSFTVFLNLIKCDMLKS